MRYGSPFDRREFLKNLSYYVENGWGSYAELINLTMKDFVEIRIGIESKLQEERLEKSMQSMQSSPLGHA